MLLGVVLDVEVSLLGRFHRQAVALLAGAQRLLAALAGGHFAPDAAIAEEGSAHVVARLAAVLVEALLACLDAREGEVDEALARCDCGAMHLPGGLTRRGVRDLPAREPDLD